MRLLKWFKSTRREWIFTLAALGTVILAPAVIRWLDPEAAVIDVGGFGSLLIWGIFRLSLAMLAAFAILHYAFPTLDDYIDGGAFADDWRELTPRARVGALLGAVLALATLAVLCITIGF